MGATIPSPTFVMSTTASITGSIAVTTIPAVTAVTVAMTDRIIASSD
jgi:hypothetical protein